MQLGLARNGILLVMYTKNWFTGTAFDSRNSSNVYPILRVKLTARQSNLHAEFISNFRSFNSIYLLVVILLV
jgi:hypothetical protein